MASIGLIVGLAATNSAASPASSRARFAPPTGSIVAEHAPPFTNFRASVTDPEGDPLTYKWTMSISCGSWQEGTTAGKPSTADRASWWHGEPGSGPLEHNTNQECTHDGQAPHAGDILVVVSDGRFRVDCAYSGAGTGTGPACRDLIDADLEVIVRGPKEAATGSAYEYRVKVINHGPYEAPNVVLDDSLNISRNGHNVQGVLRAASGSASQGTCQTNNHAAGSGKSVRCDLGSLADGGRANATIRIKTGKNDGPISISSKAHSDAIDPNPDNNEDGLTTKVK
jgi:hypothetical protein